MTQSDVFPLTLDKAVTYGEAGLSQIAKWNPKAAMVCSALTALLPLVAHAPGVEKGAQFLIDHLNELFGYTESAT